MLTKQTAVLIPSQGLFWSRQRILAISSQIVMLVILIIILTNLTITLGERRLQEDWATRRYSELQTFGSLIADRVSFQQFRTQMFANSELLQNYLDDKSSINQKKLNNYWKSIRNNIPELLGIALFDPKGKFKFATNDNFGHETLPPSLLGGTRAMGGNEIYTSPLGFIPIAGQLEPYIYQLAWLENPDQSIRGYLVTYNSMSSMLKDIKPAPSNKQPPLLMFDTQGLLYSGAQYSSQLSRLPETKGGSLKQSYPKLWHKMESSNFGQYHSDDATFVYLKIELTTQYETHRKYFLVSYIKNDKIADNFSQWRNILIITAISLTLLISMVIFLSHFYRLSQRSREFSIQLANNLFNADTGYLITNDHGRILQANKEAARALSIPTNETANRSIQRLLELSDESFAALLKQLKQTARWHGEVTLESANKSTLTINIRKEKGLTPQQDYLLVTIEDVSMLKQYQQETKINQLLADNSSAMAVSDPKGRIVHANQEFHQIMHTEGKRNLNLQKLLNEDFSKNWPQIVQQITVSGIWEGQILNSANNQHSACILATFKGRLESSGEIEYIICTFEKTTPKMRENNADSLVPYRGLAFQNLRDLEIYFKNLSLASRNYSSLILLDITSEAMLSHMGDVSQLERRQKEVEFELLRDLPNRYRLSHWQLGKLIILLPDTDSDQAHYFAIDALNKLKANDLSKGICMGIASYQKEQNLEQFLTHAEVALKRAKQTGEQTICQAYTRPN